MQIRDPRPLGASPVLRRDLRYAQQEDGAGLCKRADPHLLRRREPRRARGRQTLRRGEGPDRRGGLQPHRGAVQEPRDRLRAGLGHRYGQDRFGRAGTGDPRLHPPGARRQVRRSGTGDGDPLRRFMQALERRRNLRQGGRGRRPDRRRSPQGRGLQSARGSRSNTATGTRTEVACRGHLSLYPTRISQP